jgi:hypothetical protein
MNDKKSFGDKLGRIAATVLWTCITACLIAIMVSLTLKFIFWIF